MDSRLQRSAFIFNILYYFCSSITVQSNFNDLPQDNQTLINSKFPNVWIKMTRFEKSNLILVIKHELIQAPMDYEIPYNFSKPLKDIDLIGEGQPIVINNRIFKNRIKNGFYIEAGAFDGEHSSNSLYYEVVHGWNGLLVEPNPDAYRDMLSKVKNLQVFCCYEKIFKSRVYSSDQ